MCLVLGCLPHAQCLSGSSAEFCSLFLLFSTQGGLAIPQRLGRRGAVWWTPMAFEALDPFYSKIINLYSHKLQASMN